MLLSFLPSFQLPVRQLLAAAGLVVLTASVAAESAPAPAATHEIRDPYYGDTLFQFFQDHYFTALTELMVSQKFGRVEHHSEEAEILRAGIMLSYGLHREAGDIFTRLIDMGASAATRDRAWFYLAKIRYQRGYLPEAEQALAHIGDALPPELKQDRALLTANVMMALSDYQHAARLLGAVDLKASGFNEANGRYVRFNLGIALIKSGNSTEGSKVLDQLGQESAENEEYRTLRDRANLALGFAALADKQAQPARNYLERVRLSGPQANKALLGLGWAADALKDPRLALVPWLELAQRDVNDSAVLEAKIAVPYAYAELGAFGQSAQLYNQAISAFTLEDSSLTESIAAIQSGRLVDALIENNPGEEMGWFWRMRAMPDVPQLPHVAHLTFVLAQNEFQEAFKNYRDLCFLNKNLQNWRDKLSVYDDMLANRRTAFAERLPLVTGQTQTNNLQALRQRSEQLTQTLTQAQADADGIALADTRQLALLARVAHAEKILSTADDSSEMTAARQRIRLAHGSLLWQLAQDYPQRVWEADKQLNSLSEQLQQAQQLQAALLLAQKNEPARFADFGLRINQMKPLIDAMIVRVQLLTDEQKLVVQDIAISELKQQQQRLAQYATQARFAVAQLYDQGSLHAKQTNLTTTEVDHASKP